MRAFIWVIVALLSVETLGKLYWLAQHSFPQRTPGIVAWDCVVGIALLVWAVWVLAN
jgi:hypothetical protein